MSLAERLGGMTVLEMLERMTDYEMGMWAAELAQRADDRRGAELDARGKAALAKLARRG
jgi:hypothetical protein